MQVYKGNKRMFDTLIEEDNTTTSTNRVLNVPGITRLEELKNSIITVKAYTNGAAATTYIKINSLPLKELKLSYNNTPAAPQHIWVSTNQIYQLVYTGTYFTVVGIKQSTSSTPNGLNFNFLNNNPVTGMDVTSYITPNDLNALSIMDNIYVYDSSKASDIHSLVLSSIEWTNTYAVGQSCTVKTVSFLDFQANPVSIDLCISNNHVYYGDSPVSS